MFGVQWTMHGEGHWTVTYLESLTAYKFDVLKYQMKKKPISRLIQLGFRIF